MIYDLSLQDRSNLCLYFHFKKESLYSYSLLQSYMSLWSFCIYFYGLPFRDKTIVKQSSDSSVVFQVRRLRETLYSAIVLQVCVVYGNHQTLSSFHRPF